MDAVLRVDLKPCSAGAVMNDFVHSGGTVALSRLGIFGKIDGDRNGRIEQLEMNRLIFLMTNPTAMSNGAGYSQDTV